MTGTRTRHRTHSIPLELRWGEHRPLPARWVIADGAARRAPDGPADGTFDFTARMGALCTDVAGRCEELSHIHMPRVLISFTPSRNPSRYGLQARVTPLRFRDGALTRRHGPTEYQVQRFFVDGSEMLYLLTFCLPRFLDQPFREKLVTVFHELYHVSPEFNGDLRRHAGRYAVHSHSKAGYDSRMGELVRGYLAGHPEPGVFEFLKSGYRDLWDRHGGITGIHVPRPKLLPLGSATTRAAARRREGE